MEGPKRPGGCSRVLLIAILERFLVVRPLALDSQDSKGLGAM